MGKIKTSAILARMDGQTETGMARGTLVGYVSAVNTRTAQSGDTFLSVDCYGYYQNCGVEYTLGSEVFANDKGLMYFNFTLSGAQKDRALKLGLKEGFVVMVAGNLTRQSYTKKDGTPGYSVKLAAKGGFQVVGWPDDDDQKYKNMGVLSRKQGTTAPGVAEGGLIAYVSKVEEKQAKSGDKFLSINCYGYYNNNHGVDWALGKEVYSNDKGLMYFTFTVSGPQMDRTNKLGLGEGHMILVNGEFKTEKYTKNDGSEGVAVRCTARGGYQVVGWPNSGSATPTTPTPATPASTPTPAPTPAPVADPTPVAPANPAPATPVSTPDIQVPF